MLLISLNQFDKIIFILEDDKIHVKDINMQFFENCNIKNLNEVLFEDDSLWTIHYSFIAFEKILKELNIKNVDFIILSSIHNVNMESYNL